MTRQDKLEKAMKETIVAQALRLTELEDELETAQFWRSYNLKKYQEAQEQIIELQKQVSEATTVYNAIGLTE